MSTPRLKDFSTDITRARDLVGLGQAIGAMTNGLVDATDMYRAALVQGVAAWDRYVHGIVLDRGVDILLGRLNVAPTSRVGLPIGQVASLVNATDSMSRELSARSLLAERLSRETFQRPDDVAAALATVGINSVWSSAFPDAHRVKKELGLIVDRRNKIVHQCDYDPAYPGQVTILAPQDALSAADAIESMASSIDALL